MLEASCLKPNTYSNKVVNVTLIYSNVNPFFPILLTFQNTHLATCKKDARAMYVVA